MENTYNWRSNRATWLVGLRYNPETLDDVEYAKEDIESRVDAMESWFLTDLIDLSEINRDEIREVIEKEKKAE